MFIVESQNKKTMKKILPFAIGMMFASTSVNAADVAADNLTVSGETEFKDEVAINLKSSDSNVNHALDITLGKKVNCNFIDGTNLSWASYQQAFSISKEGNAKFKSLHLKMGSNGVDNSMAGNLTIKGDSNGFTFSTSSYMNNYYAVNFEVSAFNITKGDLTVNGKITCKDELNVTAINAKDINVELNNAADYVFDENYNLKSLSEVESYVNENKHLPGIPSAAEMAKNGMSVSAMSNMLLEKVEELTLHMIRLEKENAALKAEVKSLKK